MLISMTAWVIRFALFSYGNPTDALWMIIISCIVYPLSQMNKLKSKETVIYNRNTKNIDYKHIVN